MKTIKDANGEPHEIDEDNFLKDGVLVKVELNDLLHMDLEAFLDRISEDAGFPLLMQQTYEIEGYEDGTTILLRVRGDVSMHLEAEEATA